MTTPPDTCGFLTVREGHVEINSADRKDLAIFSPTEDGGKAAGKWMDEVGITAVDHSETVDFPAPLAPADVDRRDSERRRLHDAAAGVPVQKGHMA